MQGRAARDEVMRMRGLLPTHRLATQAPERPCAVQLDDPHAPPVCAQCGRDTGSSPSRYWCSETCMRQWLRARTRQPEAVLGSAAEAAARRMARRHAYLAATTGSWPEAWRRHRA